MKISRKYLVTIGWILVLTVITLSLININGAIPDVKNGDKIGHFLAYFALMSCFSWLYQRPLVRNLYAIGFIIMGGLMEVLQSLSPYRTADINDFHVNTIGVIVGFIFAVFASQIPLVKKTFKL